MFDGAGRSAPIERFCVVAWMAEWLRVSLVQLRGGLATVRLDLM